MSRPHRTDWSGHMARRRDKLRSCVECLYRAGLGVQRIARLTGRNKSLCFKWVRQAGVLDPERAKRQCVRLAASRNRAKQPKRFNIEKMIMEDYQRELRVSIRSDSFWNAHPVRAAYFMNVNYPKYAEKMKARAKAQYLAMKSNPAWIANKTAKRKIWGKKNRDRLREWNKNFLQSNPEKKRQYRRTANQKPSTKIAHNLRNRIRQFIGKGRRIESTSKLVGCSRKFLVQWIERQFAKGMTWGNYGQWQLDHIVPVASFNLFDTEQQKRCSHYSNLRPLWAADNLAKSDTIETTQPELCMAL